MENYRQNLQELAARLSGEITGLRSEAIGMADSSVVENIPAEQLDIAEHVTEEDRTLTLLRNEQNILSEVQAALERIEQGTFGRCEHCKKSINPNRLTIVPYTRHCVNCARRREKTAESDLASTIVG